MKIEKVYITTPTLCKNGVTKPITRVRLESPCPVCSQPMIIEKKIKGSIRKRAFTRWRCTDDFCRHSQIEEGEKDVIIRVGLADKEFGILKTPKY